MQSDFYRKKLYPLQDRALEAMTGRSAFYLTGGTAISRFYFDHRYSDDLDFFMNRSETFEDESNKVIELLRSNFAKVDVSLTDEAFVRIFVTDSDVSLKVELINDVAFHAGEFIDHPNYWKVDNSRNILSNKLCALGRNAGKDFADLIVICENLEFNWQEIFDEVQMKDTWVNELRTVRTIAQADVPALMDEVNWVRPHDNLILQEKLNQIARDIVRGEENSLARSSSQK